MQPPDRLRARALAFYLPQFHPIPENDAAWGEGFTEWTNVRKARPLFRGHAQPLEPGALGWYDLRDPAARAAQAEMARAHGLSGFVYWHYWFAGRRVLETPLEAVLATGAPDFPFCLAWANQSWTGIWHGDPGRTLLAQTYPGREDHVAHFRALLPAFRDPRHLRVQGRPLFMIYQPQDLPDPEGFVATWAAEAARAGLPRPFIVALRQRRLRDGDLGPFDAVSRLAPRYAMGRVARLRLSLRRRWSAMTGRGPAEGPFMFDYAHETRAQRREPPTPPREIPCVFTRWDNTPRSGRRGRVYRGATPARFADALRDAVDRVADRAPDERIVLIRSWNEWAEGNILEPDARDGDAWLRALRACVTA